MAITCAIAAKLSGISHRRMQVLLVNGRVPGAAKHGHVWMIPDNFRVLPPPKRKGRRLLKMKPGGSSK